MRNTLILATICGAVALGSFAAEPHPPIPVAFTLDKPGRVTLVIEDAAGKRVRNLVMDEPFPAGNNTVWWDGLTDWGQCNVRQHGGYDVTGTLVEPGAYTVRGIVHGPVDLMYQFTPYCPNNPIRTTDRTGQWLSDHTPPCSTVFVPAEGTNAYLLVGSTIAEGAHGLAWLTPKGRKFFGATTIGTTYTGPSKLTLATGTNTFADIDAWALGVTRTELTVVGIRRDRSTQRFFYKKGQFTVNRGGFGEFNRHFTDFSLAVRDKVAAVGNPDTNQVWFVDVSGAVPSSGTVIGTLDVKNPRGLAYDGEGNLFVLSGSSLLRFAPGAGGLPAGSPAVLTKDLDEPRDLLLRDGRFYISCRGASHQVWVVNAKDALLCPAGKVLKKFGRPGAPVCGPYDEEKMQNPQGLAIDAQGQLWVAEEDYHPKRLSVWDAKSGKFIKAFYGPTQYGGGGKIDPQDKARFYYAGVEFKLDWEKGSDRPVGVFARSEPVSNLGRLGTPDDPIYVNGRQYMANTFNAECITGPRVLELFRYDKDGVARPVAMFGQVAGWAALRGDAALSNAVPAEMILGAKYYGDWNKKPWGGIDGLFAWSDRNEDGAAQADELTFRPGRAMGINRKVGTLTFVTGDGTLFEPQGFTKGGVPLYDATKAVVVHPGVGRPQSQMVLTPDNSGYALLAWAPEVAEAYGIDPGKWAGGAVSGMTSDGRPWFYPYRWMGLHSSGLFPTGRDPEPGELIGGTKIIGPTLELGPDKLQTFALNANSGQIYLMTVDGLYVAPLFKHGYVSTPWGNTVLERGMNLNDRSSDGEGFFQTITRTPDGKIYLQALNHTSSIVEVTGLDDLRRLKPFRIEVDKQQLEECKGLQFAREAERQREQGAKRITVAIDGKAPVVDGKADDWDDAEWVMLDAETEAALKVADGKLYAAWRTDRPDLPKNSGVDPWVNLFKTGGGLDLMISADPSRKGAAPVKGDQRLLLALVEGKPRAILYEPKSDKKGSPGAVSSPNTTLAFDYVGDVSGQVEYSQGRLGFLHRMSNDTKLSRFRFVSRKGYFHEAAVPLAMLGLKPEAGMVLRGDIGALIGDGSSVRQRLYWNNKGTAQLFDAPSEARLTPELWGELRFMRGNVPPQTGARNLRTFFSPMGGALNVQTNAPLEGRPAAQIGWAGKGDLSSRAVGTKGYVIFRFQPKNWFDRRTLAWVASSFTLPENLNLADDLWAALGHGERFRLYLTLDGHERDKAFPAQGARLDGAPHLKRNAVSWAIGVKDPWPHRLTIVLPETVPNSRLELEQGGTRETLAAFTGEEGGACVVQFDFTGPVTLNFSQDLFKDGESGRCASVSAMFFD